MKNTYIVYVHIETQVLGDHDDSFFEFKFLVDAPITNVFKNQMVILAQVKILGPLQKIASWPYGLSDICVCSKGGQEPAWKKKHGQHAQSLHIQNGARGMQKQVRIAGQ